MNAAAAKTIDWPPIVQEMKREKKKKRSWQQGKRTNVRGGYGGSGGGVCA